MIGSAVWTVVIFIKDIIFSKEDASGMISGEEFKRVFNAKLEEHQIQEELKVDIFDRTFQELCEEARLSKKPILIITLRDRSEESVLHTLTALSLQQDLINRSYLVYGVFNERLVDQENQT